MNPRHHWDTVYQTKGDTELSWFQSQPATSLALINALTPQPRRIIDIGGGQSPLAGELLNRGHTSVTVLDISAAAIERAQQRLGPDRNRVHWIVGDILEPLDLGEADLWHDRAVFHFLTDPNDRRRYADALRRTLPVGGHAIIATFAPTGPEKCSGLPVRRYDAAALAAEFGSTYRLVNSATEAHTTPWGKPQDFTYIVLQRVT